MKLVTAILARDEAQKYLRPVLARCLQFSDTVLLLDDRSTDDTPKIAAEMGCQVRGRSVLKDPAWGHESAARQELWNWAADEAGDGWVLICDADMILEGNPRDLIDTWEVSAWAFVLWDCWDGEHQARVDGPWQYGPVTPRPWLFRPSRCVSGPPQWPDRGLHSGHAPLNVFGVVGIAPPDTYYWRHLAYTKKDDRVRKHAQYLGQSHLLTEFERMHSASIND